MNFIVDVVIPWVDGEDPDHEMKRLSYTAAHRSRVSKAAKSTRYADRGELEFCVSSILKFMPWFRKIYIVTDAQIPEWYPSLPDNCKSRIVIIDHRTVFNGFEDLLPTFNSLSIETMVWRIPGLAERFIYFNDDLALLNPLEIGDFFTADGVVIRGAWERRSRSYFMLKRLKGIARKGKVTHRFSQLSGAALGAPELNRAFATGHVPQPLRKSTMEDFFLRHPDRLKVNASFRFRSWSQFWPVSLAHHLEISKGTAKCLPDDMSLYLSPSKADSSALVSLLRSYGSSKSFLCMQSLDQAHPEFYESWRLWMLDHVGRLSEQLENC